MALVRNGATVLARDRRLASTDQFNGPPLNLSTVARFTTGDLVEAKVFQNSGGNLSVSQSPEESPELSMTWLAPGP